MIVTDRIWKTIRQIELPLTLAFVHLHQTKDSLKSGRCFCRIVNDCSHCSFLSDFNSTYDCVPLMLQLKSMNPHPWILFLMLVTSSCLLSFNTNILEKGINPHSSALYHISAEAMYIRLALTQLKKVRFRIFLLSTNIFKRSQPMFLSINATEKGAILHFLALYQHLLAEPTHVLLHKHNPHPCILDPAYVNLALIPSGKAWIHTSEMLPIANCLRHKCS